MFYLRVMASSLFAGGIEDADLEDMFEGVLGGVGGHAGGLVFASAAQGFANAVLVFRVGVVTERYLCTTKKGIRQEELRKGSYAEALRRLRTSGFVQEVLQVIGQKTSRVVGGAVTAARDAATAAGKAAKETVATRLGAALETIENAVRRKTEHTKGRAIEGQGGTGGPDGCFLGCAEAEFPQSGTS